MKHQNQQLGGAAWLVLLLLSGCVTTAPRDTVPEPSLPPPDAPSTLLSDAQLDPARLVAMAAARSRGWRVVSTEFPEHLLLERTLPADSPQAMALRTDPNAPPPTIQVKTHLHEKPDGVQVILQAFIIPNPSSAEPQRFEYTEYYSHALAISLESLQNAWLQTQHRVTSPAPIPPPPSPEVLQAVREATGEAPPAAATDDAPAPVNMLALNQPPKQGVWAYHAEQYARTQGCALSDLGAVLIRQEPPYEFHEVHCSDGMRLVLRCLEGACHVWQ